MCVKSALIIFYAKKSVKWQHVMWKSTRNNNNNPTLQFPSAWIHVFTSFRSLFWFSGLKILWFTLRFRQTLFQLRKPDFFQQQSSKKPPLHSELAPSIYYLYGQIFPPQSCWRLITVLKGEWTLWCEASSQIFFLIVFVTWPQNCMWIPRPPLQLSKEVQGNGETRELVFT